MFESKKKLKFLIEFLDGTKKEQLAGKKSILVTKKSSPGFYRISYVFLGSWPPPMWCLKAKETQTDKKSFLAGKKSFLVGKKSTPRV